MPRIRALFLSLFAALPLGSAQPLSAQSSPPAVSDSVAALRRDSLSVCPLVKISHTAFTDESTIELSPIFLRSNPDLGFDMTVSFAGTDIKSAEGASVYVIATGKGPPRYADQHSLVITIDNLVRLAPAIRYSRIPSTPGTVVETMLAVLTPADLASFRAAMSVSLNVAGETFKLTAQQVGSLRTFVSETGKPITDRIVRSTCNGQSPLSLVVEWSTPVPPDIYLAPQVDIPARALSGNPGPKYPASLAFTGKGGVVVTQFVVLAAGRADMNTFEILRSNDKAFSESVREVVRVMRFSPASIGGRPVNQLVQLPFEFVAR